MVTAAAANELRAAAGARSLAAPGPCQFPAGLLRLLKNLLIRQHCYQLCIKINVQVKLCLHMRAIKLQIKVHERVQTEK